MKNWKLLNCIGLEERVLPGPAPVTGRLGTQETLLDKPIIGN
jgi:hypothetical protein